MRQLVSVALAFLLGLAVVAVASDVLREWSLARHPVASAPYEPPSEARRF